LLRLFDLQPEAKSLFGFTSDEDIKMNPKFTMHAQAMVDMIDCAVAFLGPDLDPLTEHLLELGQRHVRYGVKPEYLSIMGRSVIFALEQILGAKFTLDDVKDWTAVFQLMISKMILGMKG
jgi:methyl-accepting chemotaxis protein